MLNLLHGWDSSKLFSRLKLSVSTISESGEYNMNYNNFYGTIFKAAMRTKLILIHWKKRYILYAHTHTHIYIQDAHPTPALKKDHFWETISLTNAMGGSFSSFPISKSFSSLPKATPLNQIWGRQINHADIYRSRNG